MNHEPKHSAIRSFHEYLEKDSLSEGPIEESAPVGEQDDTFITFAEALKESKGAEPSPAPQSDPKQINEVAQAPVQSAPAAPVDSQSSSAYKIIRDRDESFECNLSVEGTSLAEAQVRLVLDGDPHNFVFYGKIHADGKCVIPIRKGLPLHEGAQGKIRLEVIAEDQLFVGWEDQFVVEASKKVKVELKEQKSVKVNFVNK